VNESFVDLTYRGLSLGRRIKLTQVRPSSGYLELPSPMPVGTLVAISTDDGSPWERRRAPPALPMRWFTITTPDRQPYTTSTATACVIPMRRATWALTT